MHRRWDSLTRIGILNIEGHSRQTGGYRYTPRNDE